LFAGFFAALAVIRKCKIFSTCSELPIKVTIYERTYERSLGPQHV